MSKSAWKDFEGQPVDPCGCRLQVRRSLLCLPLKKGQTAYRTKPCAAHAPPPPMTIGADGPDNYFDTFVDGRGY
ncbi:MAG: hypothetical protein PHS14_00075 [Elusimicrobia bacterium]|nr:hypothetical protein [Elusimicrobiota bacterium]